jgi:hypothetical protein
MSDIRHKALFTERPYVVHHPEQVASQGKGIWGCEPCRSTLSSLIDVPNQVIGLATSL